MGGNLNRNVVYAGGAVIILLLAILVFRPHQPAPAVAVPGPPASPAVTRAGATAPPGRLAQDSTDPQVLAFLDNFKTSATSSCKASVVAQAQAADKPVTETMTSRIEQFCGCAARRVAATITVTEVSGMTVEAVSQGVSNGDTIQAIKARMAAAQTACLAGKAPGPD